MKPGAQKIKNNQSCAETNTFKRSQRTSLKVEIVDTEDGFEHLESEWSELVEHSECTVFQTFEWQRTWWKHFLHDGKHELYCLVFKDGDRVVGIVPMYREWSRLLGLKVYAVLELIGGGYTDILWYTGYKDSVFESLARHLRSASGYWDVFILRYVSATSETPEMVIRHFRRNGFKAFPKRGQACPQVSLPGTWEEYLQYVGQNMRHKVKRKTKALKDISDLEVELVERPGSDVRLAIERFADVYGRRRRRLGDQSWLDIPRNFQFITELSEKFAGRGWLRIFFLKVDSATVAANLHFHFKKRIYGYLCGVDGPAEVMKYSPGFLLHYNAIKHGISEGMGTYDMMFGSHRYKLDSFRSVALHSWQINVAPPFGRHYYRYIGMQTFEFFRRAIFKIGEEYREVKRYRLTKDPSFFSTIKFLASRLNRLLHVLRIRSLQAVRGNKMTLEEADRDDV